MLFFEVTQRECGGFIACCRKLNLATEAKDLSDLHDKIVASLRDALGAEQAPPLRDIHLILTRENQPAEPVAVS
ncbi:MAG: hypothetical protein ACFB21_10680 [Opitutales bacterium]